MTPQEAIEQEMEEHRAEWEQGYYPAAIDAFRLCALNSYALPEWLAEVIHGALIFTCREGGRDTNRRKGGFSAQAKRWEIHQRRWNVATMWLRHRQLLPYGDHQYPATRDGAFAYASEMLRGTLAQGEPQQIQRSYELVEKRRRGTPAKSEK
jgi:hypothetical protein